jgi:2-(1,2-epoxy-1,2-dihydrophenyl)acetyl-CoA isomerase
VSSADDLLLTDRIGGVLWVTLNRPGARNALSVALMDRLQACLRTEAADPEVRAVVLRGAGGTFCSGGDISEMDPDLPAVVAKMTAGRDIVHHIAGLRKPVIAAVQGFAAGAGMSLALACDLIVADPSAVFVAAYASVGLVPDLAGTYWLARQIGLYRAKEIYFTGRRILAEEAFGLGLLARLWDAEEFDSALREFAAGLAEAPTVALGVTKQLLNRTFETDLHSALEAETTSQAYSASAEDHRLAVEGWRTNQPVRFVGR